MLADYATTTVSTGDHPMGLLRESLVAKGGVSSADLHRLPHGSQVRIGGLVVARQRPATASGVTFLLLEDEHGTVNLIVAPSVYQRDRLAVRTEPLVLAHGRLERHASGGGAINIVVSRLVALEAPGPAAAVTELPVAEQATEESGDLAATGTDDFRAVAPAVMSFASGRRR
jgi:error-prone DNA polymerase